MADIDGEIGGVCEKCGEPNAYRLRIPAFWKDGEEKEKLVPVECRCKRQERENEEKLRETERKMEKIRQLKKLSLIDERLKDVNLASFKRGMIASGNNRKGFNLESLILKYLNGFDGFREEGTGLLLYGDVGTGKTYTAAVIANELMAREIPVIMTSFIKLIEEAMRFDDHGGDYIRGLDDAELLVVDDLGAERGTDFALEKVYEVVDRRYRSKKPMIITTNLSLEEMTEETDIRYTRIYDRIFEMCYPFQIEGMSWRKAKAFENYNKMQKMLEE